VADTDTLIGQTVSHYRALDRVGGGGMFIRPRIPSLEAPHPCLRAKLRLVFRFGFEGEFLSAGRKVFMIAATQSIEYAGSV
jgi:hypothetical protein